MGLKGALTTCSSAFKGYVLKKPSPMNVVLTTNTRCNFQCDYCKIWERDEGELSTAQIESLIDQMARLGTRRLGLTGGEPLLREDIGHIISYAKSKGLYVSLNTNGALVSERINDLKDLDLLSLSLDGPEAIHNLQKKDHAYQGVMDAIRAGKRSGMSVVTTTTLTRNNLNVVDFILSKAEDMGFKSAFQLIHHPLAASGEDADAFLPQPEEYRQVLKRLIQFKKQSQKLILNSLRYFEILHAWQDYTRPVLDVSPFSVRCWAGRFFVHIDVNGDVYPCHQLLKTTKAPNFLETSLEDVLNNIPDHACAICMAGDYLEYNLLFSLNPNAVKNILQAL